jgi:hypothetical protein
LSAEEFEVAAAYYNIRPVGDMHHNPAKNVLHVPKGVAEVAKALKRDERDVREVLEAAQQKMYVARLRRRTPYVDKTVYTGWNGMCVSAYVAAGRALGLKEPVEFALKSLDRVLSAAWDVSSGLAHVVAYGEGVDSQQRVAGVLEDYAFVANAALDAWEASGEMRYFSAAQEIADAMLARFYDATGCGFFDMERVTGAAAIGALSTRRKPLQDAPTPSGNAVAAMVLIRLAALTDRAEYRTRAEETLETFAGVVEHFGMFAASYGLALRRMIEAPVQVCVVGEDERAEELSAVAMKGFAVNKSVVRLRLEQLAALPPALKETLPRVSVQGSFALVCRGNTCLPPMVTTEELGRVEV